MKTTDISAKTGLPTVNMLRRIARERLRYRAMMEKAVPNTGTIEFEDVQFLNTFISESAFYIEELERYIDEELLDYWQSREHALRIVTAILMQQAQTQTKEV